MVQVKLFALRFCDDLDGFDDEPLRLFMADKDVISLREQFFFKDNMPYWSVMVIYKSKLRPRDVSQESQKKGEGTKDTYRSLLTEESTPLFNLSGKGMQKSHEGQKRQGSSGLV